jgi:hypothetical protein
MSVCFNQDITVSLYPSIYKRYDTCHVLRWSTAAPVMMLEIKCRTLHTLHSSLDLPSIPFGAVCDLL